MSTTRYEAIVEDVLAQIASGALKPGQALPSMRTLTEDHGVSGGTVRSAMLALKAFGVVEGEQGKGVFVCKPLPRDLTALLGALARPPHKRTAIVADIRARIADGELRPGEGIGTYQQMKQRYGVSLGVIREAVLVLKTEGDVDVFESGVRVAARAAPTPQ